MDPAAFVPVGRIVKRHGLAGEVSVLPADGLPLERLTGVTVWFVPPPSGVRSAVIEGVRPGPKGPLVKLSGVDGPDAAERLRGASMVARPGDVPAGLAAEAEQDPVGLTVTDEERGFIGTVEDVIVTGANDVWVLEGGPFGEVLLPVIEDVVLVVDWDVMTARVRLLPGLIEE